jgi:DNA-binding NarL/FixJ family response regulator
VTRSAWMPAAGTRTGDPAPIRLLLGDGHRSFVEALALRLDAEPGLRVVATAVTPEDALRVVRARHVDVAVVAVDGAAAAFLGAATALREARPGLDLVAVAETDDIVVLERAVQLGFRGWVPKQLDVPALVEVVRGTRGAGTFIPPGVLTRLLRHLLHDHEDEVPGFGLTPRERDVLRAMARGATRQQIADELGISPNTVRTHMQGVLTKLGVHSSLAAVALARRAGIG